MMRDGDFLLFVFWSIAMLVLGCWLGSVTAQESAVERGMKQVYTQAFEEKHGEYILNGATGESEFKFFPMDKGGK